MPSGKKVGGIKGQGDTSAPGAVSRYHRDCPKCEGERVQDGDDRVRWIHSPGCPYTTMIWKHHGKEKKDWRCPYDCEPTKTGGGWAHVWDCGFWDSPYWHSGATPF